MPRISYLVCATPRSGSTLLCELLKHTGVAGRPEEYFEARSTTGLPAHPGDYLVDLPRTGAGIRDDLRPPRAPAHSSLRGLNSYREHLARTFELGRSPNGVFGAKVMWRHLPDLQSLTGELPELAGLDLFALLTRLFEAPRYVWVTRADKVRQGVSLWRALQTRAWRLDHPGEQVSSSQLHYSFEGIDHLVRSLRAEDDGWAGFFADRGIEPLRLLYERDLDLDPVQAVRDVLSFLGLEAPPSWHPVEPLHRQADSLSQEWVATYHRDAAARSQPAL